VNPQTGAPLDSIPLGGFADADGIPEAYRMLAHDGRVYLSLQRLTNFAPSEYSLVAVIDAAADTVVDVDPSTPGVQCIRLTGTNPNSDFASMRRGACCCSERPGATAWPTAGWR